LRLWRRSRRSAHRDRAGDGRPVDRLEAPAGAGRSRADPGARFAARAPTESYNLANIELSQIDADLKTNDRHLVIARSSLVAAQGHIAQRLRALYINGDSGGAVEVILGAKSLDDLLDRLDIAERVGGQDAQILQGVRRFRTEVKRRGVKLRADRVRQTQVVAERRPASARSRSARRATAARGVDQGRDRPDAGRGGAPAGRAGAAARARLEAAASARAASRAQVLDFSSGPAIDFPADGTTAAPPWCRRLRRSTAASSGSRCSTSGRRTCGAASTSGFDCSGLVVYAYGQMGVSLPHSSYALWNAGVFVSQDQLEPGDLVFFDGLGHVGIYIGGGQFIHAPHTGDVVKISSLDESWYASTYVGAKRVT
jgi:cell wall-associated NlpC family hydrolase